MINSSKNLDHEIWLPITGYEGRYFISNWGKVKGIRQHKRGYPNGYILSPSLSRGGYPSVGLYNGTKQKLFTVHRLVAKAFLPKQVFGIETELKVEVRHKNRIKTDNHVNNLKWVTHKEHMLHDLGPGRNHGRPKLTDKQVKEIRQLLRTEMTIRDIAELFCIGVSTISNIHRRVGRFSCIKTQSLEPRLVRQHWTKNRKKEAETCNT